MQTVKAKEEVYKIDPKDIVREVCNYYEVSPSQLFGTSRLKDIVRARYVAFYLIREHARMPLNRIGKMALKYSRKCAFNHATILHGVNIIKEDLDKSPHVTFEVRFIEKQIMYYKVVLDYEDRVNYKYLLDRIERLEELISPS